MSPQPTFLRRYTDLPSLIHILRTNSITLLDPKTWDDRNDSYYLAQYKERKKFQSVLALCFSQVPETYHHWSVFSSGSSGVCIVFDRAKILGTLNQYLGIRFGPVKYLAINAAKSRSMRVSEMPFLKRLGYKPEGEFRVIYQSKDEDVPSLSFPFELDCIRSISLSPWMHSSLSAPTTATLRSLTDCSKLAISRSTLISNEQWKALAKNAT